MIAGVLLALSAAGLALAGLGMTGHMAAHMGAVAVAAPVLAFGMASRSSGVGRAGHDAGGGAPLGWATIEFVVVWAWHAPAIRALADANVAVAVVEQAMFLGVGYGLWRAALTHPASGVAALLLTSMHMTLLGALIALAPRPLYAMMAMHPAPGLDALADQQMGGLVMLVVGGAAYCLGGLALLGTMLRERAAA
ncbi:cytochrome c oxidase assembly protein [Sphingomonas sp. Leaf231]|uniref:cytochrome c oxidase assembly protein n=1 Tax=Sphingomonas sp. Leaf231 TaxID=1736301 RepID=UPI000A9387A1|nr:cytochrome c oxidase assembly protein [Sphingomonas sp. Leaf231]